LLFSGLTRLDASQGSDGQAGTLSLTGSGGTTLHTTF